MYNNPKSLDKGSILSIRIYNVYKGVGAMGKKV